jgi:hypothetical protein
MIELFKCGTCGETIDEGDALWDVSKATGGCPVCGAVPASLGAVDGLPHEVRGTKTGVLKLLGRAPTAGAVLASAVVAAAYFLRHVSEVKSELLSDVLMLAAGSYMVLMRRRGAAEVVRVWQSPPSAYHGTKRTYLLGGMLLSAIGLFRLVRLVIWQSQ